MFAKHSVKLEAALYDEARKAALAAGYSSVDEFVAHLVGRELERIGKPADEEELKKRLKGLGYL